VRDRCWRRSKSASAQTLGQRLGPYCAGYEAVCSGTRSDALLHAGCKPSIERHVQGLGTTSPVLTLLRDDVGDHAGGRNSSGHGKPQRHRRIEMPAGNSADRKRHGQNSEIECEGDPEQADADLRKCGGKHRTRQPPRTSQNVPRNSAQSLLNMNSLQIPLSA